MAGNNQKEYTFINMKRCLGANGQTFTGVTVEAMVCRPDDRLTETQTERRVIRFSTPIRNQGNYIAKMCGKAPLETPDGTVWAKVSLWDSDPQRRGLASRFNALLDKTGGKTLILMLTGSIKVEESRGSDGKTYVNTNIDCDGFTLVRALEPKTDRSVQRNNSYAAEALAPATHREKRDDQDSFDCGFDPSQGGSIPYHLDEYDEPFPADEELPF